MTEKKEIFWKIIHALVSLQQQKKGSYSSFQQLQRYLLPFLDKNIEYQKIKCKNIPLRLKTLINNIFS